MNEDPSDVAVMEPPPMSVWNGTLRFGLEVASLVGIGRYGYTLVGGSKATQWVLAIGMPLAAATLWGTLNVPNDPSRSGAAPVPVSGLTRLGVELSILGFGGYTLGVWNPVAGGIFGGLGVVHYVAYRQRITWLMQQTRQQSRNETT